VVIGIGIIFMLMSVWTILHINESGGQLNLPVKATRSVGRHSVTTVEHVAAADPALFIQRFFGLPNTALRAKQFLERFSQFECVDDLIPYVHFLVGFSIMYI
jgi:hypothetical protein